MPALYLMKGFTMRLPAKLVLLGVMSMSAVGCGMGGDTTAQQQDAPATGRVAVINLDLIAEKLDRDEAMAESLKSAAASLQEQLKTLQASYQSKLDQAVQQVSHEAPAEGDSEKQQVALLGRQLNVQLGEAKRQAQVQLTNHRQQLVAQFRAEVKPVAEQVARDRGLDIVITKNDTVVFAFASAVDITDDVVKALQAKAPAESAPARTAAAPSGQTETK
ncbi:MAG: OmpH family outer membrane protein [Maioricimonas sp. JB049]